MLSIKSYDFYYDLLILSFVDAIWLYGSRGRQTSTSQSDIDLAILCPKASAADWQKVEDIIRQADTLIKIDLVRFDELDPSSALYQNILRDKQVLFERKPNSFSWYESFLELGEALDQLEEIINIPDSTNSYVLDAAIFRIKFNVELLWKTLKKICITEQYTVTSPRSVLQKAFEMRFLDDEGLWHVMLNDRNETSHIYKRKLALEIYARIPSYYKIMRDTYSKIKKQYNL